MASAKSSTLQQADTEIFEFKKRYPKFGGLIKSREFGLIYNYFLANREKMIWAIEDMDIPPIEGVGKGLLQLKVDFEDPNTRRLAGALVAFILSGEYEPASSGHRIKWRPFVTASKYRRIKKGGKSA